MRYAFWRVFVEAGEGRLRARWPVNLNGVSLRAGDRICPAASFAGFNPHRIKGRDLEAYPRGGELVIQAVYHHARSGTGSRLDQRRTQRIDRPAAGMIVYPKLSGDHPT